MRHIVITRYALSFDGKPINHEWLLHRRQIFLEFTVPAMNSQTSRNFIWILLMDEKILQRESEILKSFIDPRINVVFRGTDSPFAHSPDFWKDIFPISSIDSSLLTTRLDSDDWLHPKFIENLQACCTKLRKDTAIFFPIGLTIDRTSKSLKILFFRRNQFASYLEHPTHYPFQTVHRLNHTDLGKHGETKLIYNKNFMWGTVVHSNNLYNKPRGFSIPKCLNSFFWRFLVESSTKVGS